MKSARSLKAALVIGLTLCASAAPAQMIYKQVDDNGKVIFTDQPRESARTIASYPTARSSNRSGSEPVDALEPKRVAGEFSTRPGQESGRPERALARGDSLRAVEAPRWIEPPVAESSLQPYTEPARSSAGYVENSTAALTPNSPAPRRYGEVERAVYSYQPLNTPLAAQVDATESARRARAEASRIKDAPVLIVKPVAPDHERLAQKKSLEFFYALWVVTFVLMAGGLLYFGWRVLELIMGRAFPRWHVGVA